MFHALFVFFKYLQSFQAHSYSKRFYQTNHRKWGRNHYQTFTLTFCPGLTLKTFCRLSSIHLHNTLFSHLKNKLASSLRINVSYGMLYFLREPIIFSLLLITIMLVSKQTNLWSQHFLIFNVFSSNTIKCLMFDIDRH